MSGSRIPRRGCRQARGRTARSGRMWPPGTRSSTTRGPRRSNGPASCPCYLRRPRTCSAPRRPCPELRGYCGSPGFPPLLPLTTYVSDLTTRRLARSPKLSTMQVSNGTGGGRAGVQLRDPRHERRSTSSREGASPKRGFHLLLALPPERRDDLHGVRVSAKGPVRRQYERRERRDSNPRPPA